MEIYEFGGELFHNVESFLETLAHEYKSGDSQLAIDTLEQYGFSLSDIGVRPEGV